MIGLIGRKLGMAQIFDEEGNVVPVSVIQAGPCPVVQKRTPERDGYRALVIGFGVKKHPNKPYSGVFKISGVAPTQILREIRDPDVDLEIGSYIDVDIFKEGDLVDVTGTTKGKGFSGVMKKEGFAGGPDSHGSRFHRAPGSIGSGTTISHVRKNQGMPGRLGGDKLTIRNLKVVKIDKENHLIFVKGAVPGPRGSYLFIRKAKSTYH